MLFFFFFNDTATTEIYTLSLHDALPIFVQDVRLEGADRHALPVDGVEAAPGVAQHDVAVGEAGQALVMPPAVRGEVVHDEVRQRLRARGGPGGVRGGQAPGGLEETRPGRGGGGSQ